MAEAAAAVATLETARLGCGSKLMRLLAVAVPGLLPKAGRAAVREDGLSSIDCSAPVTDDGVSCGVASAVWRSVRVLFDVFELIEE
jgi:hypothetical protein